MVGRPHVGILGAGLGVAGNRIYRYAHFPLVSIFRVPPNLTLSWAQCPQYEASLDSIPSAPCWEEETGHLCSLYRLLPFPDRHLHTPLGAAEFPGWSAVPGG